MLTLDYIINGDPILRYLIREAKFDPEKLEHQTQVRCGALMLAVSIWIERNNRLYSPSNTYTS